MQIEVSVAKERMNKEIHLKDLHSDALTIAVLMLRPLGFEKSAFCPLCSGKRGDKGTYCQMG